MNKLRGKKVIVIGGSHNNTLAVIRCLGEQGCEVITLIHETSKEELPILSSKYLKEYSIVDNSKDDIFNFLKDYDSKENIVLFPCSDLAAYTIDFYGDILKEKYLLFGFKDNFGKVCKLMDKFQQNLWIKEKNKDILVANTWQIDLDSFLENQINEITFPCIIKPEISAFGSKSDIRIIKEKADFLKELTEFKKKNYSLILVQEFIKKEYEICAFGVMVEQEPHFYYGIIKKNREYPIGGGGSLTFSEFIQTQFIKDEVEKVLELLYKDGFRGNFDVEFFICGENVLLNEINFRHSGNGVALIKANIPGPFISCLDKWMMPIVNWDTFVKDSIYYTNEINELLQVKNREISLFEYFKTLRKTTAFSYFDKKDLRGTWAFYKFVITNKIKNIIIKLRTKGN